MNNDVHQKEAILFGGRFFCAERGKGGTGYVKRRTNQNPLRLRNFQYFFQRRQKNQWGINHSLDCYHA